MGLRVGIGGGLGPFRAGVSAPLRARGIAALIEWMIRIAAIVTFVALIAAFIAAVWLVLGVAYLVPASREWSRLSSRRYWRWLFGGAAGPAAAAPIVTVASGTDAAVAQRQSASGLDEKASTPRSDGAHQRAMAPTDIAHARELLRPIVDGGEFVEGFDLFMYEPGRGEALAAECARLANEWRALQMSAPALTSWEFVMALEQLHDALRSERTWQSTAWSTLCSQLGEAAGRLWSRVGEQSSSV